MAVTLYSHVAQPVPNGEVRLANAFNPSILPVNDFLGQTTVNVVLSELFDWVDIQEGYKNLRVRLLQTQVRDRQETLFKRVRQPSRPNYPGTVWR
jgi:hypothetical protein